MESREHLCPMGARPVDASAVWTLHELGMQTCDIGWDCERGILMWDHNEDIVACCTTADGSVSEVKLEVQFRPELPKLVLEMVADDERLAISKDLALHEVAIPGEEPPMFCQDTRDERLIGNDLFVGGVVSEYPEPAGRSAEHGVRKKDPGWERQRVGSRHVLVYPARINPYGDHPAWNDGDV